MSGSTLQSRIVPVATLTKIVSPPLEVEFFVNQLVTKSCLPELISLFDKKSSFWHFWRWGPLHIVIKMDTQGPKVLTI